MNRLRSERQIKKLQVLSLTGACVIGLFHYRPALTGVQRLDGIICILFGLYLCAHPAAYMLDILFFWRGTEARFASTRSAAVWAAMNMLVLLTGWFIIFLGTMRLIARTD